MKKAENHARAAMFDVFFSERAAAPRPVPAQEFVVSLS